MSKNKEEAEIKNQPKECQAQLELEGAIRIINHMVKNGEPTRDEKVTLHGAVSLLIGLNNCYCSDCQEMAQEYFQPMLNQEIKKILT